MPISSFKTIQIKQARDDYERVKKECEGWGRNLDIIKKEINSIMERLKTAEENSGNASVSFSYTVFSSRFLCNPSVVRGS